MITSQDKALQLRDEDISVINELRRNARTSLKRMAVRMKLPVSTVCDRMSKYVKGRVIRNTCLLDFKRAGYNARHVVAIATARDNKGIVQDFLENHANVNNLLLAASNYDFLAETVFHKESDFHAFISVLRAQYSAVITATYCIGSDIKRETLELKRK
ncbi:Lrp/AsnC family transcriptional regulator [Candidatus Woesearchaeota archaeon]|nr:Lrp/AsnC family transcriptional regulator [Candidatus Woesearchaeota archaeon]